MAELNLKALYVYDYVTNSIQTCFLSPQTHYYYAWVPSVDYPCHWSLRAEVENTSDVSKTARFSFKVNGNTVTVDFQIPPKTVQVVSPTGAMVTLATITEFKLIDLATGGTVFGPHIISITNGWVLVTHAFMYGSEPNGKNLDQYCSVEVDAGMWLRASSPDKHMHIIAPNASVKVTAKPDFKAGFSYWIIGGTKRTDNPASFTMTYNNYAYAYIGLPVPRWLPLEDINADGKVDLKDYYAVAMACFSRPDLPNWNPLADINGDGKVDLKDVFQVALSYGLFDQDPPTTITVAAPSQAKVQTITASAINFASAAAVTMILSAFLKSIVRSLRR
jgi:hypothetical protein